MTNKMLTKPLLETTKTLETPGEGYVLANRYRLKKNIGSGSFGVIFSAIDTKRNQEVAVKIENDSTDHPQLQYESHVYKLLQGQNGQKGIPKRKWHGKQNSNYFLVIDMLGPSLEDLINYCYKCYNYKSGKRCFSMKTTLMLADQMISLIEYVHHAGFIHRDIKPDNFLMGLDVNHRTAHLIDFGLAKKYWDFKSNSHIPNRENKKETGTRRYMSINTQLGREQSRRDDMESLGYIFIYFIKGNLPWQNLTATTEREKKEKVMQAKLSTSVESLCEGFPPEFAIYLNYCKSLDFDETPNYNYLRQLFRVLFATLKHRNDGMFDWLQLSQPTTSNNNSEDLETQDPNV